jgi:hypothetical protein
LDNINPSPELHRQSFIVRVWLEESAGPAGDSSWQGSITHVPSGEHKYISQLDDVTSFIAQYVNATGAQAEKQAWRGWRHWLQGKIK